jgi:hypothetical protein
LTGIIEAGGVFWLTPLLNLFAAENKLVQWKAARKLEIAAPKTVVVSDPRLIPDELGEVVVVKPLGPPDFDDDVGATWVVHTREVGRSDRVLDGLGGAPFLVQERLDADRHLRVVTVLDQAWVCELDAEGLALDWRTVDEAHDSFVVSFGEMTVAADAIRLAHALEVRYSSQDWIASGTRRVFLDLNPAGQWLFLPGVVAGDVTQSIAGWLTASQP